jgi:hypothetical protein
VCSSDLDYNDSWNIQGGQIIASQFTIQQSISVNWMSVLIQDYAPTSIMRLGIFSDNNNQPDICLASTTVFPAQTTLGWYKLPLSSSISLEPGTYWLAESDSGACVIKYVEKPGASQTFSTSDYNPTAVQDTNVGSSFSGPLITVSGTLAIVASSGPPSIPNTSPPPTYAEAAECWTSDSSSNPYPVQTSFPFGDPIYIYWSPFNPSDGVVDIIVISPIGTRPGHAIYTNFLALTPPSAPVCFVPDQPGTWIINCNGYSTTITVFAVNVFVLPEYTLGAFLSIIACFAAFGLYVKRDTSYRQKFAKINPQ